MSLSVTRQKLINDGHHTLRSFLITTPVIAPSRSCIGKRWSSSTFADDSNSSEVRNQVAQDKRLRLHDNPEILDEGATLQDGSLGTTVRSRNDRVSNVKAWLRYMSSRKQHVDSASGYGWTKIKLGKIKRDKYSHADPYPLLKPYPNPLLVIFATSTARIFPDSVIKRAIDWLPKVYPDSHGEIELQVVSAFVEKISSPPAGHKEIATKFIVEGSEGCSFFWTSKDKFHYETEEDTEAANRMQLSSSGSQPGTFTVKLIEDGDRSGSSRYSQFGLGLTNTALETGKPCHIQIQRVVYGRPRKGKDTDDETIRRPIIARDLPVDLHQRNVRLDIDGIDGQLQLQSYAGEARSPLTNWRTVAEVSGNVIKKFKGEKEPFPASTELETAIAKVPADEHGLFEVWAEIMTSSSGNEQGNNALKSIFVRVISGGGGWGEKRGLIALDPSSTPERAVPESFDISNLFPGILQAGDKVRFLRVNITELLSVGDVENSSQSSRRRINIAIENFGRTTFGFGTTGNPDLVNLEQNPVSDDPTARNSNLTESEQELVNDENMIDKHRFFHTILGHFGVMSYRMLYETGQEADRSLPNIKDTKQTELKTDLPPYSYFTNGGCIPGQNPEPSNPLTTTSNPRPLPHGSRKEPEFVWMTETVDLGRKQTLWQRQEDALPISKVRRRGPLLGRRWAARVIAEGEMGQEKSQQPVRARYIESPATRPEHSDWAYEEKLILANLKQNAPRFAKEAVKHQTKRVRSLFHNRFDPSSGNPGKYG